MYLENGEISLYSYSGFETLHYKVVTGFLAGTLLTITLLRFFSPALWPKVYIGLLVAGGIIWGLWFWREWSK